MQDVEAFGLLVAWLAVDDAECDLPAEQYLRERGRFRDAVERFAAEVFPGGAVPLDFGHAYYWELDADERGGFDPIEWLRQMRAALVGAGVPALCVLTHGVAWRELDTSATGSGEPERPSCVRVTLGSEALRRALRAEAAATPDADLGTGWEPGVYVDLDALDALGKKLKNEPTTLDVAGARFCRVGR